MKTLSAYTEDFLTPIPLWPPSKISLHQETDGMPTALAFRRLSFQMIYFVDDRINVLSFIPVCHISRISL